MLATVASAGLLVACGGGGGDSLSDNAWYASWYGAPQNYNESFAGSAPPAKSFKDQTLRQIMYVSAGGDQVRVRVSNLFGSRPLTIDAIRIAQSAGGAAIVPSTDTPVLFGGQSSVTLAAGAEVLSSPVALAVQANSSLAVSLYVKNETPVDTVHTLGRQNNYVAPGNLTGAGVLPTAEANQFFAWTTGLEVLRSDKPNVVVTFGDSITDGFGSTVDANSRYPNFLSRRLAADASAKPVSVVNAGISGNRWKNDVIGPKGEGRFERDVLGQSGVTHTIILLGINDIGFSGSFAPGQEVTADQIKDAILAAVLKAKAKGVKALVATLTPFKGTIFPGYYCGSRRSETPVGQRVHSFEHVDRRRGRLRSRHPQSRRPCHAAAQVRPRRSPSPERRGLRGDGQCDRSRKAEVAARSSPATAPLGQWAASASPAETVRIGNSSGAKAALPFGPPSGLARARERNSGRCMGHRPGRPTLQPRYTFPHVPACKANQGVARPGSLAVAPGGFAHFDAQLSRSEGAA